MNLLSCPELCRCSPRSQPNTLSLRIPRWRSFWGGGRDFMNVRRNVISFPCFLHTGSDKTNNFNVKRKSPGGIFKSIIQKRHLAWARNSEHCRGSCHLSAPHSCRERSPPARGGGGGEAADEDGCEAAVRLRGFFLCLFGSRHSAAAENPSGLFRTSKLDLSISNGTPTGQIFILFFSLCFTSAAVWRL